MNTLQTENAVVNTLFCVNGIYDSCKSKFARRKRRTLSYIYQTGMEFVDAANAFENQLNSFTIVYGGEIITALADGSRVRNPDAIAWLGLKDPNWNSRFVSATLNSSEHGVFISLSEAVNMTNPLPLLDNGLSVPISNVLKFIQRWNNTFEYYAKGIYTLSQLPSGYDSNFIPFDQLTSMWNQLFNSSQYHAGVSLEANMLQAAKTTYEAASHDIAGTCVQVRVKIDQQMAVTRIAFEGGLELDNTGATPLENISVVLQIWAHDDATQTNVAQTLFVIGTPSTTITNGVDGSGTLAGGSTGQATWLFMALREAAPVTNTLYDVGGQINYTVSGVQFTATLLPDTITVVPDPALDVKYFWQNQVYEGRVGYIYMFVCIYVYMYVYG